MAEWTATYIADLPDSAFACVDEDGRHYPHHDASGAVDEPHLRNALSRVAQDATTSCGRDHLVKHASALEMGGRSAPPLRYVPQNPLRWTKAGRRDLVEGLAIPYGDPERLDLHGEWFDPETDLCLDWFDVRPALYDHGQEPSTKSSVVGRVIEPEVIDAGVWAKTQLDRRHRYYEAIAGLVDDGALSYSSGAMAHLVRTEKTGRILRWPWVELSLTPEPASLDTRVYAVKGADAILHLAEAARGAETALDVQGQRVLADLELTERFADRALSRGEARAKIGRALSDRNRALLTDYLDALEALAPKTEAIRELLRATDPEAAEKAAADAVYADWLAIETRLIEREHPDAFSRRALAATP